MAHPNELPDGSREYVFIGPGSHQKVEDTLNYWADKDILRGVVSHYHTNDGNVSVLVKVNKNRASNFQS